ncbi:MAG: hypothetical protein IT582_01690 [Opitutaceae bacterium]|nr:hypothetical protein [Opitutaceae bacterium]
MKSATDLLPSRRALARELGVDEKSLRQWERLPGAPQDRDPAIWRAFIEEHDLGVTSGASPELRALRAEKMAVETRLLKLKERQQEGRTADIEAVRDYLTKLGAKFDLLLTQKVETELPARVVGKDIVAARAECRAVHDEIREIVNAGFSEWDPKNN